MASYFSSPFLFLLLLISSTLAQNGLVLPIRKDPKTSQFYTTFLMGSKSSSVGAVIDLGARFLWFSCNNYESATYSPILCDSSKCELAKGMGCVGCNLPERPGCTNDTCGAGPYNPFQDVFVAEGFGQDKLATADHVSVPELIFSCMDSGYTEGLARGATGMLGLGRTEISLHKHVSRTLNLSDKFSICLPTSGLGKLSIGGNRQSSVLKSSIALKSTPLIHYSGPVSIPNDLSAEYFIGINAIRVAGESLKIKDSYFSIDKEGVGGTKISTIQNYTSLHNSIIKPLARAFVKAASDMKIKSVATVVPFRACFDSSTISRTSSGPSVPVIDLVLPGQDVYWRISGANAVVDIDKKTTCLAFVDSGSRPQTSIVIGVHQLEENFLEFDLVKSVLTFSSILSVQNESCSKQSVLLNKKETTTFLH